MNNLDWLEITILLQGNFTSVFSFGCTASQTSIEGRWPPDPPVRGDWPPWTPAGGTSAPLAPTHLEGCKNFLGYTSGWNKYLWTIMLHTQQSPTWRMIVATPSLLHLLDNESSLDLEISHLHRHPWRPIETEHILSFSLVTTFVSISAWFWLVCIFSNFNSPSSNNGTWDVCV